MEAALGLLFRRHAPRVASDPSEMAICSERERERESFCSVFVCCRVCVFVLCSCCAVDSFPDVPDFRPHIRACTVLPFRSDDAGLLIASLMFV